MRAWRVFQAAKRHRSAWKDATFWRDPTKEITISGNKIPSCVLNICRSWANYIKQMCLDMFRYVLNFLDSKKTMFLNFYVYLQTISVSNFLPQIDVCSPMASNGWGRPTSLRPDFWLHILRGHTLLVRYTYPIEKSEDSSRYRFPKCNNQNANIEVVNKDSKQGNRHAIYIWLDTRESAFTSQGSMKWIKCHGIQSKKPRHQIDPVDSS